MKFFKTLASVAAIAIASTGFSADSLFFINFDFDAGTSPTVTDPAGVFASVSNFSGGTLSGGNFVADLAPGTPASFSFDFDLADGFTASIFAIGYGANYIGSIASITGVLHEAVLLGGDVIMASSSKDVSFFTPTLTGLNSGTLTFEAVGFDGTIALEDFQVFGTVSAVPETSTMLLSGLAGIAAFLTYRRRRNAVQSAS